MIEQYYMFSLKAKLNSDSHAKKHYIIKDKEGLNVYSYYIWEMKNSFFITFFLPMFWYNENKNLGCLHGY